MALSDLVAKARTLLNDPKVQQKLQSDRAEQASDKIFDAASGVAKKVTGGKYDAKIDSARDAADRAIGRDDQTPPTQPAPPAG